MFLKLNLQVLIQVSMLCALEKELIIPMNFKYGWQDDEAERVDIKKNGSYLTDPFRKSPGD